METVFPGLLTYSFFAPILLRVALGLVFLFEAKKMWRANQKPFAVAALVIGVLVGCGLVTQVAAILGVLYAGGGFMRMKNSSVFGDATTALLSIAILLSLLITGPGGLAFDLPY